jgi:hypothetical protein
MTAAEAYRLAAVHWQAAETYWLNAQQAARSREWSKVAELTWGFASQMAKMAGVLGGRTWTTHAGTFEFLREIARASGDDFFRQVIPDLHALHQAFYEPGLLDEEQVRARVAEAWELGRRLWALGGMAEG